MKITDNLKTNIKGDEMKENARQILELEKRLGVELETMKGCIRNVESIRKYIKLQAGEMLEE